MLCFRNAGEAKTFSCGRPQNNFFLQFWWLFQVKERKLSYENSTIITPAGISHLFDITLMCGSTLVRRYIWSTNRKKCRAIILSNMCGKTTCKTAHLFDNTSFSKILRIAINFVEQLGCRITKQSFVRHSSSSCLTKAVEQIFRQRTLI